MQVLPQALPTEQTVQQVRAAGVERAEPLAASDLNNGFPAWAAVNSAA
jgi:hypothetical protein